MPCTNMVSQLNNGQHCFLWGIVTSRGRFVHVDVHTQRVHVPSRCSGVQVALGEMLWLPGVMPCRSCPAAMARMKPWGVQWACMSMRRTSPSVHAGSRQGRGLFPAPLPGWIWRRLIYAYRRTAVHGHYRVKRCESPGKARGFPVRLIHVRS